MILNQIINSKITPEMLERICKLKAISWSYSIEEQKKWIKSNLKPNDIHFLLTQDNIDIAYFNLVEITIRINGEDIGALGVGNLCTIERRKGYGRQIMKLANKYIEGNNKIGLFFCRKELVKFFSSLQWSEVDKSVVRLTSTNRDVATVIFNNHADIRNLEYNSKLF